MSEPSKAFSLSDIDIVFERVGRFHRGLAHFIKKLRTIGHHEANEHLPELITDIIDVHPVTNSFFAKETKTGKEVRLPFHVCANQPKFPLQVDWTLPDHDWRHIGSIFAERIARSPKEGDETKYRLVSVEPDGKTIITAGSYYKALDSCDFFHDRILAHWGLLRKIGLHRKYLQQSRLVAKWVETVKKILNGDYSGYHAVMGFTVAWVRVLNEGNVELLTTMGSQFKATGVGFHHLCPAGMFEPCMGEQNRRNYVTLDDMRFYLAKEAIEEVHGNEDMERGRFTFVSLKAAIYEWMSDRIETGKECQLVRGIVVQGCLEFKALVVDAFRLRPELVFVVKTRASEFATPNWENDKRNWAYLPFSSRQQFEAAILENMNEWIPPGLAGAYFAAQSLLSTKNQ